jgi:hypothetical protein
MMHTPDQHQATPSEPQPSKLKVDWVNIIKGWKASGMSQVAYCKTNHIKLNQLVYQNSKLSTRAKAHATLLPVNIIHPEQVATVHNNFVLHYPSGLRLHIPVHAHPEAIKTLINCLEVRSC